MYFRQVLFENLMEAELFSPERQEQMTKKCCQYLSFSEISVGFVWCPIYNFDKQLTQSFRT